MNQASAPQHALMQQFDTADGELLVGGMHISRLAARVGRTPFYAYDRALLSERVAQLRQALPAALHLHYAMKANPMPAVVQHMAALTDGIDVASVAEMQVALDTGTSAADISFAGPGKGDHELRAAVAAGVIINLESAGELERTADQGTALGVQPRVAIRVNPDFELKSSGMKMGGGAKPFGVDADQVTALIHRAADLGLDWRGLHIYSGSQNLRPEAITEAQQNTFALATRLASEAPLPLRWLNIGGGLGIPYFPGEQRLDLAAVAGPLAALMSEAATTLPQAEIVMELGRFLVAEAGVYVCRVIDRKVSRGEVFLVTDGGLHHHLAASGNFGQVIRKNYPVCVATRMDAAITERASVVGPLCTPLDLLADRMELPIAEPGDLIAVFQSGAYGYTASPHGFLSHPPPLQVLV